MAREDYAFLDSQSEHRSRLGDTSYMNPEFAAKLSIAIRQAQKEGLPIKVMSGFREGSVTGSKYDMGGYSSHSYGLASDIDGLDGPNGKITKRWAEIAEANGLHNPYGVGNKTEYNHWQLPEQPLEKTPALLASLKAAKSTGDMNQVWDAWHGSKVASNDATKTMTDAPSAGGVDIRSSIYQMLIGKGLSPQQSMGVIYSMMGESGTGLDTSSLGDSGKSLGFGQWNGERRANLEAIAKKLGVAPTDASAQLAHFKAEIDGPYAAEIENVKNNATSAADATRLWTGSVGEKSGYERPAENNWKQRYAQGAQIGSIGDDGAPVWKTPPAATTTGTPSTDTPGPPKTIGEAIARLTKKEDGKSSALSDMASAFSPPPGQGQGGSQSAQMLEPSQDSSQMIAGPAQQLLSQTMAAQARPLSWSVAPFGAEAGPQGGQMAGLQQGGFGARQPGLTLNSLSPFGYG